jgi:proteic killer suppression protein
VIVSFRHSDTELLWATGKSRRIPAEIRRTAWKKLAILNAAVDQGPQRAAQHPGQ